MTSPFTITAKARKHQVETALGVAVVSAKLEEPQLGQAKVAALAALRLAFVLTMGLDDALLHVELTGDGVNLAAKVGID